MSQHMAGVPRVRATRIPQNDRLRAVWLQRRRHSSTCRSTTADRWKDCAATLMATPTTIFPWWTIRRCSPRAGKLPLPVPMHTCPTTTNRAAYVRIQFQVQTSSAQSFAAHPVVVGLLLTARLAYESIIFVVDSCLSVCISACHAAPSNHFFFLFLDGIILWPSVLHVALYKTVSSIFDLGALTPKIYSPKICNCTKSPITRLVWQIDRRYLRLLGGFRGWPIQWNHAKCCGPTLVAMTTTFGQILTIFLQNRL